MKRSLWTAAALTHLTLVGFGAAGRVPISEQALLGRVVETYRAYSGAGNGYGFFAPGVAAERRVLLHVFSGGRWGAVAEAFDGVESSLRLLTTTGLMAKAELRQPLAASWAARAFGAVPDSSVVLVEVEVYLIPPMDEFRRGARPQWVTESIFPFARSSELRATAEPVSDADPQALP